MGLDQANPESMSSPYSAFPTMFRRPPCEVDQADAVDGVIYGLPFDRSTNHRPGARYGPRAVRGASLELWWGDVWPWGFDPFDRLRVIDAGDVAHPNGRHEQFLPRAEDLVSRIVGKGAVPFGVGGDHSTTIAPLRALAKRYGPMSLVQFDAHADTGITAELTHGSVVRYAIHEGLIDPERTLQVGIRTGYDDSLGIHVWDAAELVEHGATAAEFRQRLERVVSGPTYVTVDVDGLDAAFVPGTGTPVPGGLTPGQLYNFLRQLHRVELVGCDVVETAPDLDPTGWVTSLAAASALLDLVCVGAARKG